MSGDIDELRAAVDAQAGPVPTGTIFPRLEPWETEAGSEDGMGLAPEPEPWPAPSVPGVMATPEIPASLLPGAWGAMAEHVSRSTQTPPAMAVMAALGVLGVLLQRRYTVDLETFTEPLALWTVSVSPSGTRKTGVASAFQAPLVAWEKRQADRMRGPVARNTAIRETALKRVEHLKAQAAKASEADLEALRRDIERELTGVPDELRAPLLFVEDITPESLQKMLDDHGGRMGVLSDEPGLFRILAGLYSGGSGASLEVFLKGHAGSPLKVHRASRSVFVDRPAVSMALMVQPDLMKDLAGSNQFRASGLMARFLYAVPVTNVGKRNVYDRHKVPPEVKAAYESAVLAMLEGHLPDTTDGAQPTQGDTKPIALTLTDSAMELWLEFSQQVEDQQGEGGPLDAIRDWTSKLPGAVARVAAALQLADSGLDAREIGWEAMGNAIRLAWLLVPHTQAAFGLLGADKAEADAVALLKWVRATVEASGVHEFTQRDAQRAMQSRFSSSEKLQRALVKLMEWDCVRLVKRRAEGAKKPAAVVQVNPGLMSLAP